MSRALVVVLVVVCGLVVVLLLASPSRTATTTTAETPERTQARPATTPAAATPERPPARAASEPPPLSKIDPDRVTAIELRYRHGEGPERAEQTIELVRAPADDDRAPGWRLAAPVEGEADRRAVETLLDRLAELELRDVAADTTARHRELEVDEETGIVVRVFAGEERLAGFVVGSYLGGLTMVRMEGEDVVWRALGPLRHAFSSPQLVRRPTDGDGEPRYQVVTPVKALADWRNRSIFELERDSLTRLELRSEGGHFVFERRAPRAGAGTAATDWEPVAVDAPRPPDDAAGTRPVRTARLTRIDDFEPAKVRGLASTLARLRTAGFVDSTDGLETGLDAAAASRVTFRVGEGAGATSHTLVLGADHDAGSVYVRRTDREQTYLVSKPVAARLRPDVRAFRKQ